MQLLHICTTKKRLRDACNFASHPIDLAVIFPCFVQSQRPCGLPDLSHRLCLPEHTVKFCNSCTCMHVLARHTYVESLHSTHVLYLAGRIEEEALCPDPMLHEEISDTCREPHGIGCLPPASALRPKVGYQSMQRCDILITGQQPRCQLRLEISSITSLRPNNSPR